MGKAMFTAAELEEMAAWDAKCEAEPLTDQEIRESRQRDREAVLDKNTHRQRRIAERQRHYYERNREQIAEQKRQYRERKKADCALTA